MPPTIYALLVGINDYLGNVPRLNGCINDVKQVRTFLEERTKGGDYTLDTQVLTSGDIEAGEEERKPTRQALIDGFKNHLVKAGEGDVALFYYSGHGSQEKAPLEFWPIEPDHLDETLVCYDSRTEEGWDLADKELAVLIAEVAQRQPHIIVILDSCHSGSGTRAADGTAIRLAPTDLRDRPLDSFLDGVVPMTRMQPASRPMDGEQMQAGGWFTLPEGRHVVLAACRPEEAAREKTMENGKRHGVLSYYLLDTLQQVGPTLTYRDVFARLNTLVRGTVRDQNPILAASTSEDLERPFLGGAIVEQIPYYDVVYEEEHGWIVRAGAVHGIVQPVAGETTHLALFPLEHVLKVGTDLSRSIGHAEVTEVGGTQSTIDIRRAEGYSLDRKQSYKGVVTATPLPPVAVHLSGDDTQALDALRERLNESMIARAVEEPSAAALRVMANQQEDRYLLKRAGDREALGVAVEGKGRPEAVREVTAKVEHIAQWLQLLNLENKQTMLPTDAVQLELYRYDPASDKRELLDATRGVELLYDPRTNRKGIPLQIRLHHTGSYPDKLYCMLANLTEDFGVITGDYLFGRGVWLEPGQEEWATYKGQKYIHSYVPRVLRDQGIATVRDVLKLIVSTDESDANLLRQNGLEVVTDETTRGLSDVTTRGAVGSSTLHRLMRRFPTRAIGEEEEGALSDWRTTQILMTTESLREGVEVPGARQTAALADGVQVEGHPALGAKASLVPFDEGKRDIGNLALPALFRDHPELAHPFNFRPSRGGDAGESVIVLRDVSAREAVTREAPLVFRTDAALAKDEVVLPIAYDPESELFLPLGIGIQKGHQVEIRVEHLPAATADSRDVAGSIKLFFEKVVAEKIGAERLGLDGKTARLAAATVDEEGRVVYDDNPLTLKEKVANARSILLFVHGFVGDTRGMVASGYGLKQATITSPARLVDHYDLFLAWDYENINTPIEETALKLKAALAEVGLKAGHDKQLHVIAHSMGCVVTRWLIERDNGNKIIQKAVLVGPPNAGTPLATYQDYALIGLGAALNGLTALVWPPAALPAFAGMLSATVGSVEAVDVTLDQLKPDSTFYKVLNASDDPGVPYVVVAGNTSKIPYANPAILEKERSLLHKLAERLTSTKTRNKLLSLAFFNHPNDMAISLKSMMAIPAERNPQPTVIEVPCDHISYFSTEVGLRPLVEQLLAGDRGG